MVKMKITTKTIIAASISVISSGVITMALFIRMMMTATLSATFVR